jgi:hypothetical protein
MVPPETEWPCFVVETVKDDSILTPQEIEELAEADNDQHQFFAQKATLEGTANLNVVHMTFYGLMVARTAVEDRSPQKCSACRLCYEPRCQEGGIQAKYHRSRDCAAEDSLCIQYVCRTRLKDNHRTRPIIGRHVQQQP